MVGLKNRSRTQKFHPKVVNPRDIAGERKEEEEIFKYKATFIYFGVQKSKTIFQ